MAVPKRKLSSARKNKRRSNVWKLQLPALTRCSECGSYKAPHRVCPTASPPPAASTRAARRLRSPTTPQFDAHPENEQRESLPGTATLRALPFFFRKPRRTFSVRVKTGAAPGLLPAPSVFMKKYWGEKSWSQLQG